MPDSRKDFFISHHKIDIEWAEWIARQLDKEDYAIMLPSWDILPGTDSVAEREKAIDAYERTMGVLSPDYLQDAETRREYTTAFNKQKFLPVRVRECKPTGFLETIVPIDLVGLIERKARAALLSGVKHGRVIPTKPPLFPGSTPPIWHIPEDNPFFIGHEEDINSLHSAFTIDQTGSVIQHVLNGLGGIGKTQMAIKYAHRHRDKYKMALWINGYTRETINADFIAIAGADFLDLQEKDMQNQDTVNAVLCWLENHTDWLLVFDNVEAPTMVKDYIPAKGKGHILLTTRTQIMGTPTKSMEIAKLTLKEGALLLLYRARLISSVLSPDDVPSKEYEIAMEISELMDGHPLALDQAGAYIEKTACGLAGYLASYQKQRAKLLKKRGDFPFEHPESVAATWLVSFENVKQANQTAYDLLQLCAFLYSDAIPEKAIIEGAPDIGCELDEAVAILRKFSFIHRDPLTKTLTVHRLVQAILKDQMGEDTRRQWAERAVRCIQFGARAATYDADIG